MRDYFRHLGTLLLAVSPLVLGAGPLRAADAPPTPGIDAVAQLLTTAQPKSVDELVAALPSAWRSNYVLVYASDSLQSASLAKPRAILFDNSRRFYLSFSQNGASQFDTMVEMAETYAYGPVQFAKVAWDSNGQPSLERNPAICSSCHAVHAADGSTENDFIWRSYPNWSGVYGSLDDMDDANTVDKTRIPPFQFETNALASFKQNAASLPGYRHLLGLDTYSYFNATRVNLGVSPVLNDHHLFRIANALYDGVTSVDQLNAMYLAAAADLADNSDANLRAEAQASPEYQHFETYRTAHLADYKAAVQSVANDSLGRLQMLVAQYGTDADKTLMNGVIMADGDTFDPTNAGSLDATKRYFVAYEGLPQFEVGAQFDNYWLAKSGQSLQEGMMTTPRQPVAGITGITFSSFLTDSPPETASYEFVPEFSYQVFRDLKEYDAMIPSVFKRFAATDIAAHDELAKRWAAIEAVIVATIKATPNAACADVAPFIQLPGLSAGSKTQLQQWQGCH